MLASYARKRPGPLALDEIGLPAQLALFERAADRLGRAPPVIDGRDVQADPRGVLGALVRGARARLRRGDARLAAGPARQRRRLGAGLVRRGGDVDRLRAAAPRSPGSTTCPIRSKPVAEAARPLYERLARHKLAAV